MIGADDAPMMHVGVLGPLAIDVDGRPLIISSARERAIVEALALHAGHGLKVDSIIEAVWADNGPPNARKVVQTYVSRLRKVLPPGAITSESDGYRLAVDGQAVDWVTFEQLVLRAGSVTLDRGAASMTRLREALGLWRGEPFVDLADVPWVVGERVRLLELRRAAEEDLLDAMLAHGEHVEATAAAEAAVAAEPLRERRWGQLMIALFRSGRQADALRAYQRCRQALIETLGIEPGPELRDLEQAVLAHDEHLRQPAAAPPAPAALPAALEELTRLPIVGRAPELAALAHAWEAVCSGGRSSVVLTGEPGAGKTRLAAEFATTVVAGGGRVLYGRCLPELGLPYQPIAEALGAPVDAATPNTTDADPDTDQYPLFRSVRDQLAEAAALGPLLLVIEDLHWATPPTWRLLGFLAASPELHQVLLLGTMRGEQPVEIGTLVGVSRLPIGPLNLDETAALVGLHSADDVSASPLLHELAGGNPFLVEQLLLDRVAIRDGRSPEASRAADVVGHRLWRLTADTRAVLDLAALVGIDFDVDVLAAVSELGTDVVLEALESAETDGLLRPAGLGRFSFCHALVRSVLVDRMPASRKLRYHRDLALWLEGRPAASRDVAALARHFVGCAPLGFGAQAVAYNRAAGDAARRSVAFEEAAMFYAAALEAIRFSDEAGGGGLRCDLLIGQGEALRRVGDPRGQSLLAEAIEWARERSDGRRLAATVLALNRFGLATDVSGVDSMARLAEEALGLLGDEEALLRARVLAVLAAELTYLPAAERRLAIGCRALAIARELDDDEVLAHVLVGCLAAWAVPEDLQGRLDKARELVQLAERLQSDELACRGHRELALASLEAGDDNGYRDGWSEVRRRTDRLRQPTFDWELAYMHAADRQLAGDLDGAEAAALDAMELGRRASINANSLDIVRMSLLAILRWDQGRLDEIEGELRRMAAVNPSAPFRYFLPLFHLETGDAERARVELDRLAVNGFVEVPRRQTWPTTMSMVAEASAILADTDMAASLHEQLLPLRGRVVAGETFRYTVVDRILGRLCLTLGRLDDADRHLAAAEALCTRLQAPLLLARVGLDRVRLARARGDEELAQQLAGGVASAASAFGANGIVTAANRLS